MIIRGTRLLLVCWLLGQLVGGAAAEEAQVVTVGLLPVTVEGDYQPLTSEQATSLLFQGLQASKTRASLVLLERQDNLKGLPQVLEYGQQKGLDLVFWGVVRFRKGAVPDLAPGSFTRGRLEIQVATEADLQVAFVPQAKLVLSQPTMVVSSRKTLSWVTGDTHHLSVEQSIAANSLREVADSLVYVVRRRHQAGWFEQH